MRAILMTLAAGLLATACSQPGDAPAAPNQSPAETAARGCSAITLDGYCGVTYGMSADEAVAAFKGNKLNAETEYMDGPIETACYYLSEEGSNYEVSFMVEQGQVQRSDIRSSAVKTDAGVGVGSTLEDVNAAYPSASSEPNHYVPEFIDVTVTGPTGHKLIFSFDDTNRVTNFRSGVEPQVDYVEGCS